MSQHNLRHGVRRKPRATPSIMASGWKQSLLTMGETAGLSVATDAAELEREQRVERKPARLDSDSVPNAPAAPRSKPSRDRLSTHQSW